MTSSSCYESLSVEFGVCETLNVELINQCASEVCCAAFWGLYCRRYYICPQWWDNSFLVVRKSRRALRLPKVLNFNLYICTPILYTWHSTQHLSTTWLPLTKLNHPETLILVFQHQQMDDLVQCKKIGPLRDDQGELPWERVMEQQTGVMW